ncbi:hypothetical protein TNCV_1355011 [Trichonephila clavipes]|uniref:Uncharacterized protein n=1 Tax=Trichonephila clavipes TaxID=2585209 RepID=A0A8X6SBA6_TRICX|nr:hypothetical protein TNCV_1355011 [Trichonephila clavipes]
MVSVGTEFSVGDIKKCFDEARRSKKAKHEKWAKYYDRSRNDVQIKKGSPNRVMPSTSGYNLRPRRGAKVETDQPMRRGHNKEDQFEPEEAENITTAPTSKSKQSSSWNTRSRSSQQQSCQERKGGANSNRSISLEVLVGDVNYKT